MPHSFAVGQDTAACQHHVTPVGQKHVQKHGGTHADLDTYSSLCCLLLTFCQRVVTQLCIKKLVATD